MTEPEEPQRPDHDDEVLDLAAPVIAARVMEARYEALVLRAAHYRAQSALVVRIEALAKTADAETLRTLADAYMHLPAPGED